MDANELMDYKNALQQIEDQKQKIEHLQKAFDRKFKEWENQRDTIEKLHKALHDLNDNLNKQYALFDRIKKLNVDTVGIMERVISVSEGNGA